MPRGGGIEGGEFWGQGFLIIFVGLVFVFLLFAWIGLDDNTKIREPFDSMEFVGAVTEGSEEFLLYTDARGYIRWYRTIVIAEGVKYVSEYPAVIDKYHGDEILIRVGWDPNEYANCKRFLKIAGDNPTYFCERYHLPLSIIRARCGDF